MLCVIRGCNILLLDKLDYTKHPTSRLIQKISIYDYNPELLISEEVQTDPVSNSEDTEPLEIKQQNKGFNSLYESSSPPSGF